VEREQRREGRKKEKEIGRKRKNTKNEGTRIICSFLHILNICFIKHFSK
jgi:hypothetical protein